MSTKAQTIAHNTAHLDAHLAQQAEANVTGGECPKCGGGANPTILANFGHCLTCQRTAFFGA
tara:strand:- start:10552 stop:10737 length:186 start_codon:yes stop_codon:yes gene_type:complete